MIIALKKKSFQHFETDFGLDFVGKKDALREKDPLRYL